MTTQFIYYSSRTSRGWRLALTLADLELSEEAHRLSDLVIGWISEETYARHRAPICVGALGRSSNSCSASGRLHTLHLGATKVWELVLHPYIQL